MGNIVNILLHAETDPAKSFTQNRTLFYRSTAAVYVRGDCEKM